MSVVGFVLGGYALYLMSLCDVAPYIAWAYLILSPVIALSSMVGFYGAWRVKADVEREKSKSDGDYSSGAKGDDDGLQTTGQVLLAPCTLHLALSPSLRAAASYRPCKRVKWLMCMSTTRWCCSVQLILEGYFHVSLLVVVVWLWIIIETLAVGTAGSDGSCHADHDSGVGILAYGGVAAILALMLCMHNIVKICSFFEILQSLTEGINMCLLLLGIVIMLFGSLIIKQTLCTNMHTLSPHLASRAGIY
jgi:hypothetical protein